MNECFRSRQSLHLGGVSCNRLLSAKSSHSGGYEVGSAPDSYEYTFEIMALTEKQKIIGGSLMFLMDLRFVVNLCLFFQPLKNMKFTDIFY